jgi:hypothetical protein
MRAFASEARRRSRLARPSTPGPRRPLQHHLDDLVRGARGNVHDPHGLALAQHGGPVADSGDLDQAVRDEDHGAVAAPLAADHLEHALGQVGRERCGHLVEHQHVGLDRERASEVDDPERGQRHAPRHGRQIETFEPKLCEPVAERLDRRLGQAEVRA